MQSSPKPIPRFFFLTLALLLIAAMALVFLPSPVEAAAPGKPGTPTAASGDGTMTVSWTAASGSPEGYEIRYDAAVNGNELVNPSDWTDAGSDTSYTYTLSVGETYYFQVRALDSPNVAGPLSPVSVGYVQYAVPPKLEKVAAAAADWAVTLSWDPVEAKYHVTRYQYRQGEDGTNWGDWTLMTPSGNSYTVPDLQKGDEYFFQVRAVNALKAGPESGTVTATPVGDPRLPNLNEDRDDAQVTLSWNDPKDDEIDGYHIRQKRGSGSFSRWRDIPGDRISVNTDPITYKVTGLDNAVAYTFEVRPVSDDGDHWPARSVTAPSPGSRRRAPPTRCGTSGTSSPALITAPAGP